MIRITFILCRINAVSRKISKQESHCVVNKNFRSRKERKRGLYFRYLNILEGCIMVLEIIAGFIELYCAFLLRIISCVICARARWCSLMQKVLVYCNAVKFG